jgi:glutamine cyclotransferase
MAKKNKKSIWLTEKILNTESSEGNLRELIEILNKVHEENKDKYQDITYEMSVVHAYGDDDVHLIVTGHRQETIEETQVRIRRVKESEEKHIEYLKQQALLFGFDLTKKQ